ncbi:DUF7285 family protein [Halomarina rubra]|uniref:DUF7285 family protein n=1 Tax=Halomarina rubra TaxID=2071873 RepID=UPI0020325B27|nr:hypothetical protein [Halomarina rubra]
MRRAQVEPLAALLALTVVCTGLSLYAGVLDGALDRGVDEHDSTADLAADHVRARLAPAGVAAPARLDGVGAAAPDGYHLDATLTCRDEEWTTRATAPPSADRVTEPVSVRVAPGRVRPCRLTVAVWS